MKNKKYNYKDKISFILDGNPAHKGMGEVLVVYGHSVEVELLDDVKEFEKGSVILVGKDEII